MREAICGFYGGQYVSDLLVLALFLVLFMALGLLIRPLMANVNRMVARQVRDGGLFNGEDVDICLLYTSLLCASVHSMSPRYQVSIPCQYDLK